MSTIVLELMRIAPFIALVSLRVVVVLALLPAPFGDLAPMRIRATLSSWWRWCSAYLTLSGTQPRHRPRSAAGGGRDGDFCRFRHRLTARITLAAAEMRAPSRAMRWASASPARSTRCSGEETLPTTTIMNSLGILTFFALRGHHAVFEALYASITLIPAGETIHSLRAPELTALGAGMVAQGLRIAAPVVATMFITQLGTALIARAAPRVQIFALSFGVTVSVAPGAGGLGAAGRERHLQSVSSLLPTPHWSARRAVRKKRTNPSRPPRKARGPAQEGKIGIATT